MPSTRIAILSLILALPAFAAAQEQPPAPSSVAILFADATPKATPDPSRDDKVIKAMSADLQRLAKLASLPQDGVEKAAKNLFFPRELDLSSVEDAAALGKKVRAQAVATASVSIISGVAVLTLRLFDIESGKKLAEKTVSGPVEDLTKLADASMDSLCAAWTARPKPLPPPPAPKASAPSGPTTSPTANAPAVDPTLVSLLAGYETVLSTSLELEFSRASSPFAFGIELAYARLDPFAHTEDLASISALGRWWPQDGKAKKGLFLALAGGLSHEANDGFIAGPFSLAIGYCVELGAGSGSTKLDRSLRLLPEIGFSWSSGATAASSGIVGFLPFAGVKTRF